VRGVKMSEELENEAESAEKILGYTQFDSSTLLFFTPLRIIVVNMRGASSAFVNMGFEIGRLTSLLPLDIPGLSIATEVATELQKKDDEKIKELAKPSEVKPDTILRAFKNSFAIKYDDIKSLELCIAQSSWDFQGIRVKTEGKKYEFYYVTGDFGFELDHLNKLLRPLLADKISFRG
jgi:hypothetical protein